MKRLLARVLSLYAIPFGIVLSHLEDWIEELNETP
jgi:hypothetical protein